MPEKRNISSEIGAMALGFFLMLFLLALVYAGTAKGQNIPNVDSLATPAIGWMTVQQPVGGIYASARNDSLWTYCGITGCQVWRLKIDEDRDGQYEYYAGTLTGGEFQVDTRAMEIMDMLREVSAAFNADPRLYEQVNALNNDAAVTGDPRVELW